MNPNSRLKRLNVRTVEPPLPIGVIIELVASLLMSGAPIPMTLEAVGEAMDNHEGQELAMIGRSLVLGAGWKEAWKYCPPRFLPLEKTLVYSWEFGAPVAQSLHGLCENLEKDELTQAKENAERLGVKLALPLGLCFLPAFIVLAVFPIIALLAGSLW